MTAPHVAAADADTALDQTLSEVFDAAMADTPTADTPATPAAPPAEAPATPASAPVEQTPAAARDPLGRFTTSESTPAAAPPVPPESPAPAPPAPDTASDDLSAYPPFTYKVQGREVELPGSHVGEHGILITTEQAPQLARLLAESQQNRDFGREIGRAKADGRREGEALKAEADATFSELLAIVRDPARFDEFAAKIQDPGTWDRLRADARTKVAEKRLADREKELADRERDALHARLIPQLEDVLGQQVTQMTSGADMKDLFSAEDRADLTRRLRSTLFSQIFEADPENPADPIVNLDVIRREVQYEAGRSKRLRAQLQSRQQVQKANDATKATVPAPPTVGAKQTPQPSPRPKPAYQTAYEADQAIWGKDFDNL